MKRNTAWITAVGIILCIGAFAGADEPAAVAPVMQTAAVTSQPVINPDTQIFKRTVCVDGKIEDGEWDTFYTFTSGDWQMTTYADWDWKNLYVGAKSNKPFDLLCALDANDDGWFHGDDNLEFKITRGADGNLVTAISRYESRNVKTPTPTPVSESEASLVEVKSGQLEGQYVIEMRVPFMLVRNFKPSPDSKVGFQINVKTSPDETAWVPTSLLGDVAHCVLVVKKFASLKPLVLGFDLKETSVARGDTLVGRFHMTNTGTETLDVRSFVIAGEGKAGAYLNSERIRLEGLPPKKHYAHDTSTIIPSDMPVGSWALGAEVRSEDARLGGALVSFDVVEPFEIELNLPSEVPADTTSVTIQVAVRNNTRKAARGRAKIILPVGWELVKNADTREFIANPRGSTAFATFKAKPPIGELGKVPVKAEVTIGGETKIVEGSFTVAAH
ncbi:MAG: hypothetical protein QHI38_03705 [Armatimonadota bacterium]|nr:hypothetical protein [Armatimonadota bacterium]